MKKILVMEKNRFKNLDAKIHYIFGTLADHE